MLEKAFNDVYTKFKLHFYQNVFQRFATREATLTTVESFCMEGIMAMGEPTIAEFSRMMQISTPNAAYKIGSLVKKGYVEKIQSTTDRREYHLRPTQKYIDYYNISYSYLHTVDLHHAGKLRNGGFAHGHDALHAEGLHRGQRGFPGGKTLKNVLVEMQLEFGVYVLKCLFQHRSCASDSSFYLKIPRFGRGAKRNS